MGSSQFDKWHRDVIGVAALIRVGFPHGSHPSAWRWPQTTRDWHAKPNGPLELAAQEGRDCPRCPEPGHDCPGVAIFERTGLRGSAAPIPATGWLMGPHQALVGNTVRGSSPMRPSAPDGQRRAACERRQKATLRGTSAGGYGHPEAEGKGRGRGGAWLCNEDVFTPAPYRIRHIWEIQARL